MPTATMWARSSCQAATWAAVGARPSAFANSTPADSALNPRQWAATNSPACVKTLPSRPMMNEYSQVRPVFAP